jgi:hypothetical protein
MNINSKKVHKITNDHSIHIILITPSLAHTPVIILSENMCNNYKPLNQCMQQFYYFWYKVAFVSSAIIINKLKSTILVEQLKK